MKKVFSIILCMFIVLSAVGALANPLTSTNNISMIPLNSDSEHRDIIDISVSPGGQTYAVLSGGLVEIYQSDHVILHSFTLDSDTAAEYIACVDDSVWFYDQANRIIHKYSFSGERLWSSPALGENFGYITGIVAAGERLLILAALGEGTSIVWRLSENEGLTAMRVSDIIDACYVGGDRIIFWQQSNMGNMLADYDIDEDATSINYPMQNITGFTADSTNIFWIANSTLFRMAMPVGDQEVMASVPSVMGNVKLFSFNNDILLWQVGNSEMQVIHKSVTAPEKVLTIDGGDNCNPVTVDLFARKHPDYRIEVVDNPDFSTEKYLPMMMSQDSNVDIFILPSDRPGTFDMISKGFYADLSASDMISADSETWYPRIKELSTRDGAIFGYPFGYYSMCLAWNEEDIAYSGMQLKTGITWDEYYNELAAAPEVEVPLFQANAYLLGVILRQQLMKPYFNNQPITKESVRTFLEAGSFTGPQAMITYDWMSINRIPRRIRFEYMHEYFVEEKQFEFLPTPTLDGTIDLPVTMWWMVVNPFSKQQDVAFDYIVAEIENRVQNIEWPTYMIAVDQLSKCEELRNRNLQEDDIYELLYSGTANFEVMKRYENWMDYLSVLWAPPFDDAVYEVIDGYEAGTIPIDEAVDRLYSRIELLMLEKGII